ncbi:MAG: 2-hydroxyacyl-CoA dehydratase family protein, partial [Dehalococcoidia bacterium]|nr:2-hydroxyacyl-CoA dehydratase family protein [Dehalococcoidia bacterium]
MATETEIKKAAERKRPINRVQSMYALRAEMDKQYQDTVKAQKEGRPIAWCTDRISGTFLNVMDVENIYPENYGTSCAAAGLATAYINRSEAEGFPNFVCSYAQNCFGYTARMMELGQIPPEAPRGGMPKPALLVGNCGTTCDTRYKWIQSLGRYLDVPVWITEAPGPLQREALMPGVYERDVKLIVDDLRDFVAFIEKLFHKKFDYAKFEKNNDQAMEMTNYWYEITEELRKARPSPMHARDHYSCFGVVSYNVTEPGRVKELFKKMYDEVKYRVDNKISGINTEEKYRVSWAATGPWHSMNIFDELAERGWNFPRQGYNAQPPIDLSWVKDPIEKLVRYRRRSLEWNIDHDFPPEEATEVKKEIMEKGFTDKLDVVDARDYQLDGVILHSAITCR